jgi:hypothetical protein
MTTGVFGNETASIDVAALGQMLATLDGSDAHVRVVVDSPSRWLWFASERPRTKVAVASGTPLSLVPARDANALLTKQYRFSLRANARDLRRAMMGCSQVLASGSAGGLIFLYTAATGDECWVMAQGFRASASVRIDCSYDGPVADLAMRFTDLAAAIKHITGEVTIRFDTHNGPVVVADVGTYRCFLRVVPQVPDGVARYPGVGSNVPTPSTHLQ